MAKRVIILLLLAAAAVGLIMYFQGKETAGPKVEEITPAVATGNVDDAVNALLSEITDEQLSLGGEVDEKTLLFSDNLEAGAFSQSADENEF